MRMSYFLAALVPLTLANPLALEPRTAATVLADLKAVTKAVGPLNAALNKFDDNKGPTTNQALAVQNASDKVSNAIKKATSDTNSSPAFNAAQSKQIYTYVKNTLGPATIGVLQNFIDHQPGFSKKGFASLVKSGLQDQKGLAGDLSTALIGKSVKQYQAPGQAAAKQVADKFDAAIAAYS